MKQQHYNPDIIFPPSYILKEIMDRENINQKKLENRLKSTYIDHDWLKSTLNDVLNNQLPITILKTGLVEVFGGGESLWENLQKKYEETRMNLKEDLIKERKNLEIQLKEIKNKIEKNKQNYFTCITGEIIHVSVNDNPYQDLGMDKKEFIKFTKEDK